MPIENDFLTFAGGAGANVLTQAQYAALTTVLANGFGSGVAQSAQLNKVWRQSSVMAAVLAQFIIDNSGQPAIDDGTTATLEANLLTAIKAITAAGDSTYALDTGTADAYVAAYTPPVTALIDGMVRRFKAKTANTGAATLAIDGLTASPILGAAHSALQGGEIVANGDVRVQWNSSLNAGAGAWLLIDSTGGALQVANGLKSGQAVTYGQFFATAGGGSGYFKFPNGVLFQWGVYSGTVTAGSTYDVNYPTAFPGSVFTVLGSVANPNLGATNVVINTTNVSNSQLGVSFSAGGLQGMFWFAIGN